MGYCPLIQNLYKPYVFLRYILVPRAPPNFLTEPHISRLLEILPSCSIICLTEYISSVVPLLGMSPNCPPPIVVFPLSFLSTILSLIFILTVTHNVYICQSVSLFARSLSLSLSLSPSPCVIQCITYILHNTMLCVYL